MSAPSKEAMELAQQLGCGQTWDSPSRLSAAKAIDAFAAAAVKEKSAIIADDRKYLERIASVLGVDDSCLVFSDIVKAASTATARIAKLEAALRTILDNEKDRYGEQYVLHIAREAMKP